MTSSSHRTHVRTRRVGAIAGGFCALALIAACSSTKTTTSSATGGGGGNTGTPSSGASSGSAPAGQVSANAKLTAPTKCGDELTYTQADPDHIISTLPTYVKNAIESYPYNVRATPWSTFKGKKGPWKIGFISVPISNPWQANVAAQLKTDFAQLKAKGLVSGNLDVYVQPSSATSTPEQQSAVIGQMVRQGIDGIVIFPADSTAETPAIDAAGKAGVPVVTVSPAPTSKYAINLTSNNQSPSYAGTLKILVDQGLIGPGKSVNTLFIRGVPGVTIEQSYNEMLSASLKPCPGIKSVGTIWGQWNPATTKTEVLKFLASHPGKIDFIAQQGAMQAGVVEAYEQIGKKVPPMPWGGSSGGDLNWWNEHKATYHTVGGDYGGLQMGYTAMNVLTRILAGKGPLLRDFPIPPSVMTNANIADFATPGKSVTWVGDPRGPVNGWGNNTNLNYFFKTKGGLLGDS